LAPLTGPAGALLGALVDNGPLLPFVAGAEATRAFPTGFLSATFVWVRTENAAAPVVLLGTAPDVDVTGGSVVVVFFSRSAAVVLDGWVPFTPWAVPGRLLAGAEALALAPPAAAVAGFTLMTIRNSFIAFVFANKECAFVQLVPNTVH